MPLQRYSSVFAEMGCVVRLSRKDPAANVSCPAQELGRFPDIGDYTEPSSQESEQNSKTCNPTPTVDATSTDVFVTSPNIKHSESADTADDLVASTNAVAASVAADDQKSQDSHENQIPDISEPPTTSASMYTTACVRDYASTSSDRPILRGGEGVDSCFEGGVPRVGYTSASHAGESAGVEVCNTKSSGDTSGSDAEGAHLPHRCLSLFSCRSRSLCCVQCGNTLYILLKQYT